MLQMLTIKCAVSCTFKTIRKNGIGSQFPRGHYLVWWVRDVSVVVWVMDRVNARVMIRVNNGGDITCGCFL